MDAFIIFDANYLIVLVAAGLVLAWWRVDRSKKVELVAVTIVACGIAFILSRIVGHLYFDPRPFVVEHVKPVISHAADNGFPSDHALLTMTLTAVASVYDKRIATGMLVLTVLIGLSRILALVHSPLDIAAGWVIGVAGATLGYYIIVRLFKLSTRLAPELMGRHGQV